MENGEKHQAFTRLALKRVNNALKAISLVGNLGNRSTYEYEEKEVTKIFKALVAEVETARSKFKEGKDEAEGGFSF